MLVLRHQIFDGWIVKNVIPQRWFLRAHNLDCGFKPHEHAMLRLKTGLNMTRYGNLRRGKRWTMIAMFMQFKDSGNQRWDHPPPLAMFVSRISYQTPHTKKPLLQSLFLIFHVTSPAWSFHTTQSSSNPPGPSWYTDAFHKSGTLAECLGC